MYVILKNLQHLVVFLLIQIDKYMNPGQKSSYYCLNDQTKIKSIINAQIFKKIYYPIGLMWLANSFHVVISVCQHVHFRKKRKTTVETRSLSKFSHRRRERDIFTWALWRQKTQTVNMVSGTLILSNVDDSYTVCQSKSYLELFS